MKAEAVRIEYLPRISNRIRDQSRFEAEESVKSLDAAESKTFWDLLGPYKQRLYNFILKSLWDRTGADDVYQETILRGWKYFGSYKRDASFRAWLFGIAHNEIKKHRRHGASTVPLKNPDWLEARDETVDQVLVREVYQMAETLKPAHREVFFLFYDSGLGIAEIALATGLKEGNVKFILHKIRNSLRKTLGG